MGIYFLRKEFAHRGANSFLKVLILIGKIYKNNGKITSPESVRIYFNNMIVI